MAGGGFYSRYKAAMCLELLGRPRAEVHAAYEECFRGHPHRAEPLVRAAALARKAEGYVDAYDLASRAGRVARPAERAVRRCRDYEYRALDEQAIAAYYTERYAGGRWRSAASCWTGEGSPTRRAGG